MNILLVTGTFPPSANGVSVSVHNLYHQLKSHGHFVKVLTPTIPPGKQTNPDFIKYWHLPNPIVKDYPLPSYPLSPVTFQKLADFSFDVIHVHHPFHIFEAAKQLALIYNCPLIFTYHTRYDEYLKHFFHRNQFLASRFKQHIISRYCNRADLVISPSIAIQEELSKQQVHSPIQVLPSGIPRNGTTTKINNIRSKYGLTSDHIVLLSLSRVSKEKNIDLAIKALKHLPAKYRLLIVGDGNAVSPLKSLVKKLNVDSRVIFTGKIDYSQTPSYYASSDIFLLPSLSETQGLTILEAFSRGLPIVATDSAVSREWIPANLGFLSPNHSRSFASFIKKTKINQSAIKKEAINWSQGFTIDKLVSRLEETYDNISQSYRHTQTINKLGWQSWSLLPSILSYLQPWSRCPIPHRSLIAPLSKTTNSTPIHGWCSWYAFGPNINHRKIISQLQSITKHNLPIDYILIDDGWAENWGDWNRVDKKKFPSGLTDLSKNIRAQNLKIGLWVAPFLCHPNSRFAKHHSDWLANDNFKPINGFKAAPLIDLLPPFRKNIIDITNPKAYSSILKMVSHLVDSLSLDLIKLDFLYAPYFIPGIDSNLATSLLRQFVGDLKLHHPKLHVMGCGMPFISAINTVDSLRIGPDSISPFLDNMALGGLINTIKINLALKCIQDRQWSHDHWIIDPDAFVCRPSLHLPESLIKRLQTTISACGGNIFLGDDLTCLDQYRLNKYIRPLFK